MSTFDNFKKLYDLTHIDKSKFKGMNEYEYAIEHNEIKEFYFGIGKYYQHNSDYHEHDSTRSFVEIENYSKKYGNKFMLNHFKNDLTNLANQKLSASNLSTIIHFIFMYYITYESEKKFEIPFGELPQHVKDNLKVNLEQLDFKYNQIDIHTKDEATKKEEKELTIIHDMLLRIKERFGVDVLN